MLSVLALFPPVVARTIGNGAMHHEEQQSDW